MNKDIKQKNLILFLFLFFLFSISIISKNVSSSSSQEILALIDSIEKDIILLSEYDLPFQKYNDSLNLAFNFYNQGQYNNSLSLLREIEIEISQVNNIGTRLSQLEEMISNTAANVSINISSSQLILLKQEFLSGNLNFVQESLVDYEEVLFTSLMNNFKPLNEEILNLILYLELENTSLHNAYIEKFMIVNKTKDFVQISYLKTDSLELLDKLNNSVRILNQVNSLGNLNVSVERIKIVFLSAMTSLSLEDEIGFLENLEIVDELLMSANNAYEAIVEAEKYMFELKNQSIIVEDLILLEEAKIELNYENYEDAYSLATNFNNYLLEIENSQILLGIINRSSAKNSIENLIRFWWLIIIVAVLYYFIQLLVKYNLMNYFIIKNDENQTAIVELRKNLQKRYYVDKLVDKETFDSQNTYYDNKEFKLKQKNDLLKNKLSSLEKNKLLSVIKEYNMIKGILFKKKE